MNVREVMAILRKFPSDFEVRVSVSESDPQTHPVKHIAIDLVRPADGKAHESATDNDKEFHDCVVLFSSESK